MSGDAPLRTKWIVASHHAERREREVQVAGVGPRD